MVVVGTGMSTSTVPVWPGLPLTVLVVVPEPVQVLVVVLVGTGTSIITVPVCPGVAGTVIVVI